MTKYRPEEYFTRDELRLIEEAVAAAEKGTSGEVAVMVAASSDRYRDGEVLGAALAAGFLGFTLSEILLKQSPLWFFPLAAVLFFPARLLFRSYPPLAAAFVGSRREEAAVGDAALKAFVERGLHRTRGNTGVLFYLSLLERFVVVLADKGIYERIGQEALDRLAARVTRGMKEGNPSGELLGAVAEAGDLLRTHFPAGPEDVQELSDAVIID